MDTLTLKSIELKGKHGVYSEERKSGNRFELDVILHGEFKPAGDQDDLALTINYESIESIASGILAGGPSKFLIESLCLQIGNRIFDYFPEIQAMEIALRKMHPPLKSPTAYAEIRMKWQR